MKRIKADSAVKRIPLRTCVICRKKTGKRELIRLVCVSGGNVEVDTTGKKPGRGAYLCSAPECWEAATRGGRLEHVLRTGISPESLGRLLAYAGELGNKGAN